MLIADILFMENSRPVHRQLLSGLHRMPPRRFEAFKECIITKACQRCRTYLVSCSTRVNTGRECAVTMAQRASCTLHLERPSLAVYASAMGPTDS